MKVLRDINRNNIIIGIVLMAIICLAGLLRSNNSEVYAIRTETKQPDGNYFKYVTQKTVKATYLGNLQYLDENGKVWTYDKEKSTLTKGSRCTLVYHDNGTPDQYDDLVVEIRK